MPNILSRIIRAVRSHRRMNKEPLRIEFVVTDYCNLNCKGCTHYSSLAPKEFEPIETLSATMEHLGRVAGNEVEKAYLIGGETLLYPYLTEAIVLLRKFFPKQKLYVFTNGIALPKMGEDFWDAVRDNSIIIAITRYPINFDYDAIEKLCSSRGVQTEIFGDRSKDDTFFRFALDPKGRQNKFISHLKCYNRGRISVIGDKLYPCSISACVGHLNKAHGTSFEHVNGDRLDVFSIKSASEIRKLRNNPVPFCRYCIQPPASVKYGPSKRSADEWVEN